MLNKYPVYFLFVALLFSCGGSRLSSTGEQGQFVSPVNRQVQYEGRVEKNNDTATLYWSGTTARIRFRGTGVKALMSDYNGQNYFNVIVDGGAPRKMKIDSARKYYVLAENLSNDEHTVVLFKRTQIHQQYRRGYTKLYGFVLDEGSKLLSPPARPKRKIEFYGNSITCGHAIEDTTGGDSGASIYENNYLAYGALTARHFGAQYSCISKSGIGVMVSFGPHTMPELYNRLNPFDSTSTWNFSNYTPDIVVVNLFQNDVGIVTRPEYEHFKIRFGNKPPSDDFIIESYQRFITQLRSHYPNAHIICALGSMSATQEGSRWPGYVRQAVANMNDQKVYTHFFAFQNKPGHPRVKDHQVMAESLISFINSHIKW